MEDMHDTDFLRFFDNAEYDKIVADRITPIAHTGKNLIAAKFMSGGELCKGVIARRYAIG